MKLKSLVEEVVIREYLENTTNEDLVKLMEGISSCGQAVKSGAKLEVLKKALVHPSLENHADDLFKCRSEIKAEINKLEKSSKDCNCPC